MCEEDKEFILSTPRLKRLDRLGGAGIDFLPAFEQQRNELDLSTTLSDFSSSSRMRRIFKLESLFPASLFG